ncbi:reverse transcriptase domain-containing protein [Tanacetum coccineum]
MSVRLADKSFQYHVGIAEHMLVEVGKFTFPTDFVILEMEEDSKKSKLVSVLKKHKEAFAWKTTDISGICPSFCKHKIQLLDDNKPVVKKQRRLNPNMQEVFKKEIVKLLDTDIIFLIADSPWVSPIYCIPKKGGITVVTNENDELVPTRTVTDWRGKVGNGMGLAVSVLGRWFGSETVGKGGLGFGGGIDFIGPFPKSHKFEYIIVAVDYVSKWAETQALPTNDARVVITFLKKLFCHFGMPKALISDRALKRILDKIVKDNLVIWSRKLDDALWVFRTAYKIPTGTTPYKLMYGKNCHLPFQIEHRAYWVLKNCNPDPIAAGEKRMF